MHGHPRRQKPRTPSGFSVVELLVAILMGAILLSGLVQFAAVARSSFRLQEAIAEVQESGRFAIDTIGGVLRQTAFTPTPWAGGLPAEGLTSETQDDVRPRGDRLGLRTWSDRNCFDLANSVTDSAGLPRFFLKETVLELNGAGNLIQTCRYGPAAGQLVTQLRRQGTAENVDDFQVLYAEDVDSDGIPDWWVPGGLWWEERLLVGLQVAVLLSSTESVTEPVAGAHNVLDKLVRTPADGKFRRVFTYVHALSGRNP